MTDVNITELRQNLPEYVAKAKRGVETRITVRGKVVARIVPDHDEQESALTRLKVLRKTARVGDVVSPLDISWDAERDPR